MARELTTTSYAILGLLAIRSWTTYELATQMQRTLAHWWPRATSGIYEEPKKLVAHQLATASRGKVGRRPRTVYSITPAGRRALRSWLHVPPVGPSLEAEHLVKLLFADHGRPDDALIAIGAARTWAANELGDFSDAARPYLSGEGPFPERMATNMIVGRFMVDYFKLVYDWATWASESVERLRADPDEAIALMRSLVDTGDDVRRAERGTEPVGRARTVPSRTQS